MESATMMKCLPVLFLLSMSGAYDYVDVKSATVYHYPGQGKNSLFGSVVGRAKKWLLVGAPGDSSSSRKGYGSFYSCKPGKATSCKRVPFHREAVYWNINVVDELEQPRQIEGSSTFQHSMTCLTPSLSEKVFMFANDSGCGMCWVTSTCKDNTKNQGKGKTFSAKTCVDEVSAALLKGAQRQLLMMNRGSWYSQGLSNATLDSGGKTCDDPFLYIKTDKAGKARASIQQIKGMDKTNGYRGLSSATVDFDGDGESDFIVGVPFSDSGIGSIEIFNKTMSLIGTISGKEVFKDGPTGFGTAVTATDLNGDGFDDIVVGAPDFGNRINPYGRVFVFYHENTNGYSTSYWDSLDGGDKGNGHFGSVISGVGDINYDGYNDLCVGNSHFDGNIGKVMIYYGSKIGVLIEPPQVIYGSDFNPPVSSFGMAISSRLEQSMSNPDILVGADNAAVYLRIRPIVYAYLSIRSEPNMIDLDTKDCAHEDGLRLTCFTIHTCINLRGTGTGSTKLPCVLEISLDTDVSQPRAFFVDNHNSSENVSLVIRKERTSCTSMVAFFKDEPHWEHDIVTPIRVKATLHLKQKVKGNAKLQPILAPTETSASINIVKRCGLDDFCHPDLYVNGSLMFQENEQGIPEMELMVTVGNDGETAFKVQLLINLPDDLRCWTLSRYENEDCSAVQENPNGMLDKCKLRKKMAVGEEITSSYFFALDPEHNHTTCTAQFANLTLFVDSENPEQALLRANNYYVVPYELPYEYRTTSGIPVTSDHNIAMTAPSTTFEVPLQITHTVRLSGDTDPAEINDKFDGTIRHTFVVTNEGSHSLGKGVELEIIWPAKDHTGGQTLRMTNPPMVTGNGVCNVSMTDCSSRLSMTRHPKVEKAEVNVESPENCTLIGCSIEDMAPHSTFNVTVHSTLDVKSFLENRKGVDDEEDVNAYYFTAKAHLSAGWIIQGGDLHIRTKLQRSTSSLSVRMNGELWTYTLLVILVHLSRLMIPA